MVVTTTTALGVALVLAQGTGMFMGSRDHAAIQYSTRATSDDVAKLNRQLQDGQRRLSFDAARGYLPSVLAALDISIQSQTLVYSETSFQPESIAKTRPRALYFNDTVAVGWVKGGEVLEVAAQDPEQGVIFYALTQKPQEKPQFARNERCLQCHLTSFTGGVPGLLAMSMLPLSDNRNEYAQGWAVDHRTPLEDRWGGWYVTGTLVPTRHLGNVPVHHVERSYVRAAVAPKLVSVTGQVDAATYLSPHSDVVALLVLNHQVQMTNLLTRIGWETRLATHDVPAGQAGRLSPRVRDVTRDLVDYLLFVDEAQLPAAVRGSSAFAQEFSKKGPRDSKGRSLRELDLTRRLLRYPCSYMIYSETFDAIPEAAKNGVYARMWEILSGKEKDKTYARLSLADRQAIVEILRETKKGLPQYFQPVK